MAMHATGKRGVLTITFQSGEADEIILRNCGPHDVTYRNP